MAPDSQRKKKGRRLASHPSPTNNLRVDQGSFLETNMTDWTLVETRLPPYDERVLVGSTYNGEVSVAKRTHTDKNGEQWANDCGKHISYPHDKPYAWAALPIGVQKEQTK